MTAAVNGVKATKKEQIETLTAEVIMYKSMVDKQKKPAKAIELIKAILELV